MNWSKAAAALWAAIPTAWLLPVAGEVVKSLVRKAGGNADVAHAGEQAAELFLKAARYPSSGEGDKAGILAEYDEMCAAGRVVLEKNL